MEPRQISEVPVLAAERRLENAWSTARLKLQTALCTLYPPSFRAHSPELMEIWAENMLSLFLFHSRLPSLRGFLAVAEIDELES